MDRRRLSVSAIIVMVVLFSNFAQPVTSEDMLGWGLSADHAGGGIRFNAVCGGKDESIVRDGNASFLRY